MSIAETAKAAAQGLVQGAMAKLVPLAPDSWIPGGVPDPLIARKHGLIGSPVSRLDGSLKDEGRGALRRRIRLRQHGVRSARLRDRSRAGASLRSTATAAEAAAGVVLVMTHLNAPRMNTPGVFGSSPTAGRPGGSADPSGRSRPLERPADRRRAGRDAGTGRSRGVAAARFTYEADPSTTTLAEAKADGIEQGLFMGQPLLNEIGNAEAALATAAHRIDNIYRTPRHNHNPIEPHAATIAWVDGGLVVHRR